MLTLGGLGGEDCDERVVRLTDEPRAQAESWRLKPLVSAFMCLRGIDLVAAVTLAAEIGDFSHVARAVEAMGFIGLVPSEHTTGGAPRAGRRHAPTRLPYKDTDQAVLSPRL